MSIQPEYKPGDGDWMCATCGVPLEQKKMQARYLGNAFDVTLPQCPRCGQTFVPKTLAEGKMAEVEALLEDK